MSKKGAKSVPGPDTNLAAGEDQPPKTVYDQLEHSVWTLPSPSQQYEAFNKLFGHHIGGVCHETILSEELYLVAAHCHKFGITANKLGIVVECIKHLFEMLQRRQLESRRQAFEWIRDYLKQRTESGDEAPGSSNSVKLSQDQCCQIMEHITETILKELDLYSAVLGNPMEHDITSIAMHLPTPVPTLPPLSSATYEPIRPKPEPTIPSLDTQKPQEQAEPDIAGEPTHNKLDEAKEAIISRMVAIDVAKAKAEVQRTIANYQAELESRVRP